MRQKGFTLVELLVVIAIMSILTVITVSQFGAAQKRSRDTARKADLNSLSKALLNYYADWGYFPQEDEIDWGGEFADDTGYVYMKLVPSENYQSMGFPQYCYKVAGSPPNKFALFSILENDKDSEYNKYGGPYNFCSSNYNFVILSPNAGIEDF